MTSVKTYLLPANFRLKSPNKDQEQTDWKLTDREVPRLGNKRSQLIRDISKNLGHLTWRFAWQVGDNKYVTFKEAVKLYEEAYEKHLRDNPSKAEYLRDNARDVYDNDQKNIQSGSNYFIQSHRVTHLQDIAIRRVMSKLGYSFKGSELIKVRQSRNSNEVGRSLSPKNIPFHKPEIVKNFIPSKEKTVPSIEDFWQLNRVIQFSDNLAKLQVPERMKYIEDPNI